MTAPSPRPTGRSTTSRCATRPPKQRWTCSRRATTSSPPDGSRSSPTPPPGPNAKSSAPTPSPRTRSAHDCASNANRAPARGETRPGCTATRHSNGPSSPRKPTSLRRLAAEPDQIMSDYTRAPAEEPDDRPDPDLDPASTPEPHGDLGPVLEEPPGPINWNLL